MLLKFIFSFPSYQHGMQLDSFVFCSYLILVFKIPLSLFFEYVKHSGSFNYWKGIPQINFIPIIISSSTYSYTQKRTVLNNFWLIHLYFKK